MGDSRRGSSSSESDGGETIEFNTNNNSNNNPNGSTNGTNGTTTTTANNNDKNSSLNKMVSLISRDPQARTDFECNDFIPLLKKHIDWFNTIQSGDTPCRCCRHSSTDLIKKIIKRCKFLRCPPGSVFIKQGDVGDSMYAILQGTVSVHVIFEIDSEKDCLEKVEAAAAKKKLNKNDFGNEVAHKYGGSCIGEVALVSDNCLRTATCITTTSCDFIVIDRELYNVSVKDYIEKEFQDKKNFVERNHLFKSWAPKQRNQLVISLRKETIGFGDRLARQGHPLDNIYFILKGDVEIHIDNPAYKKQFSQMYSDLQQLLPHLDREEREAMQAPHVQRKKRMASHKPQQICILGANETIGTLEIILGLDTYIETSKTTGECDVLVLKRSQFERTFKRKFAAVTMEKLKEALANRLCLYIYQSDPKNVAFLKYLNMKLADGNVLQEVRRRKNSRSRVDVNIGGERMIKSVEEQDIISVMKRLHMNTDSAAQLPPEDMSEVALAKMDRRLRLWSEKTNMNGSRLADLQNSNIGLSVHDSSG